MASMPFEVGTAVACFFMAIWSEAMLKLRWWWKAGFVLLHSDKLYSLDSWKEIKDGLVYDVEWWWWWLRWWYWKLPVQDLKFMNDSRCIHRMPGRCLLFEEEAEAGDDPCLSGGPQTDIHCEIPARMGWLAELKLIKHDNDGTFSFLIWWNHHVSYSPFHISLRIFVSENLLAFQEFGARTANLITYEDDEVWQADTAESFKAYAEELAVGGWSWDTPPEN